MPLYEYQCEDCGLRFEHRQHINDAPLTICPECGGRVHRLFQPVGIIFKGSGFYVTDNRAKSPTSKPGAKHKAGSAGESQGGSGSQTASTEGSSGKKTDD